MIKMKVVLNSVVVLLLTVSASAQKIDQVRMERDIKVAENILKTLIKQQFDNQRMFFPLEVSGNYQEGYGVTFRLPPDYTTPIAMTLSGELGDVMWLEEPGRFSYSFSTPDADMERELKKLEEDLAIVEKQKARIESERSKIKGAVSPRVVRMDSLRGKFNEKVIAATKEFMIDYGDLLSQLPANEKIVVTNQGEQPRVWVNRFTSAKRSHLSMEITKSEIVSYKQGKLTRDQALAKVKVVNTESVEEVEPDLELLSSIFSRLYRSDLSPTYFTDGGIYYERLKDFGAVYYMQVYSSTASGRTADRYTMPTVKLEDIDKATRDKKVKELYPTFEKELKENMLEYGRTVKSLGDNESLVFNVKLTKCEGCGIPTTLELAVKGSVLKEYSGGKINKDAALGKITVKKGANQ